LNKFLFTNSGIRETPTNAALAFFLEKSKSVYLTFHNICSRSLSILRCLEHSHVEHKPISVILPYRYTYVMAVAMIRAKPVAVQAAIVAIVCAVDE
jgi:hypothetical protein